ncbi:MAG: helix-turn-helix transcriptional regulator [Clostridia bacterium]|nr:helix-turn-helix transcriptional regulator [Clostridia bacterium]
MKHNVLFYNSETDKTSFQLQSGTRSWGILMLITAGRYTLELPNTNQMYTLSANTISYIPPNTFFVRKVEETVHFHQFHIQYEENDILMDRLPSGILPIPPEQVCAIGRSLHCLDTTSFDLDLHNYILEHILVENYLFSSQYACPQYSEDIYCVLRYMEEHLTEDIKLITLAEIAGLSPTGLIWKFHQQLNTTPQQHFIHLRMQLAKQLLVETSLPITQIAEKCGYSDVYYFSNAFRKKTGVSPSTFRMSPRI